MTSFISYSQNQKPTLESKNMLSEKWSNNESIDTDLPVDTTVGWYNQMHNGTDCYFYADSTFKIRLWRYGVSSGLIESIIKGYYSYNPTTKEIILIFDTERSGEVPISYYTLQGLLKRGLPFLSVKDKKFPIFSKTCLKIENQTESGEIWVDLYAYKKNGKKVSFGRQVYIQSLLDKNDE